MSFRYIDPSGCEHRLASLQELVTRIKQGEIRSDSLIFDERLGRWQSAHAMDIYEATLVAAGQGQERFGESQQSDISEFSGRVLSSRDYDSSLAELRLFVAESPHAELPVPHELTAAPTVRVYGWRRLWARCVDYIIGVALVAMTAAFVYPSYLDDPVGLQVLVVLVWVPVEAAFVSRFRTTPGKFLLSTWVVADNGSNLSYSQALDRALRVWAQGMGAGLPLIYLMAMGASLVHLKKHRVTAWDRAGSTRTLHGTFGWFRACLAVAIILGMFVLVVIGYAEG